MCVKPVRRGTDHGQPTSWNNCISGIGFSTLVMWYWTLGHRRAAGPNLRHSLSARGVRFINPPAVREGAVYPSPQKLCLMKDPDGNVIELIELAPLSQS